MVTELVWSNSAVSCHMCSMCHAEASYSLASLNCGGRELAWFPSRVWLRGKGHINCFSAHFLIYGNSSEQELKNLPFQQKS